MTNIVEVTVTTTLAEQQSYYMELNDAQLKLFRSMLLSLSMCPLSEETQERISLAIAEAMTEYCAKGGEYDVVKHGLPIVMSSKPSEYIVANGKIVALDKGDEVEYTITYQADDEQHERSDVS